MAGEATTGRGEKCCPLSVVLISAHTGANSHTHAHWEESISMHVEQARVFDSEVHSVPSPSVRDSVKQRKHNDQTVLQVVSEAQLCTDFTVDVLFCLWVWGRWVEGWGGGRGFPVSVAYIWKRMEKAAPSGFMNKKGHKRAVAVTHMDSPLCSLSQPHLWRENEHLRLSIKW